MKKNRAQLSRFIVGDLQVHPDRGCVVRNGEDIPLEPRAIQVLEALARKADRTMTSTQLQLAIWKTDVYGDNPVTKTLSELRKALGDDARNPRYIETVTGRGYRLMQAVSFSNDYRRLPKPTEPWKAGSPFVGLAAFEARHAKVFAGRTNATGDLLDAMRGQIDNGRRFVLIAGSSGCGKTSLLHAGVLPLITASGGFGGLHALSVATCDLAATLDGNVMLPLASALSGWALHDGVEPRPVFGPQPIESLARQLIDTPATIAPAITEAFRRSPGHGPDAQPHAHLMLVIDHAEILVRSVHDPAERSAFERTLCALCDAPRTLVTMIVRADYAPDLAQALPALNERKTGGGHLDLLAPNRGEIAEMIRDPAWQAGLEFEVDEHRQRLDDALRDAAIGQPDALPLLQHTLQQLYEDRIENTLLTWDAYRRIGGLEGAIAHRAEEVFVALPVDARTSLDTVLAQLIVIQSDSDAVTARRASLASLPESAHALVDAFVAGRLFVRELHDGRPHFGVVHEALLRQWPRAVEWMKENRRLLMAKARLRQAADRWDGEGRGKDHLLNPGRPLAEAIEVVDAMAESLDPLERAYVTQSRSHGKRMARLRKAAMSTLAFLTVLSLAMTFASVRSSTVARDQQKKSTDLTNYIVGELTDRIDSRGDLELLESVVSKVLEYCRQSPPESMRAVDLSACSKAARELGEVRTDQSRFSEARRLIEYAIALSTQAMEIDRDNRISVMEAGHAHGSMGKLHYRQSKFDAAIESWQRYLDRSESLLRVDSDNPDFMMDKSFALNNLATAFRERGELDIARTYLMDSSQLKKKALDIRTNPEWEYENIVTESMIASIDASMGRLREASISYENLIRKIEKSLENNPRTFDWERQLTSLMQFHALVALDLGDLDLAQQHIDEAMKRLSRLTSREPDNSTWRELHANAIYIAANIRRSGKDPARALEAFEDARNILVSMNDKSPYSVMLESLATSRIGLLRNDRAGDEIAARAIDELKTLSSEGNYNTRIQTADALLLRAAMLLKRGQYSASATDVRSAEAILDDLASDDGRLTTATVRARIALLGGRPPTSERTFRVIGASGYRHPDYLVASSLFCDKRRKRHRELPVECPPAGQTSPGAMSDPKQQRQ